MHQGLVLFQAVGTCVIAGSSHKKLHVGPSMMIAKMHYDISDHEFFL